VRTIFPSAAAMRRVACVDFSEAMVSLRLRFDMGFDVDGCLIWVVVMRLLIKAASTPTTTA
jgi:hypothetical protein